VRPDNVVIAVDSLGLVSGNLLVPISVTEKGGAPPATTADVFCNYPGSTMVFTNALSDGTLGADAQDCAAWTDVGGQAWMGRADATDPQWSEACQNATCGFTGALYCFEQ
jgi:hypothetical protein